MEFWESLASSAVRLTVPIALAALGELISERAGVLNLGLEGYMAAGAFAGLTTAAVTGSVTAGIAVAVAAGLVAASIMALVSVRLGAGQIICGFAVLFLCLGVVDFLAAQRANRRVIIESIALPPRHGVGGLAEVPAVGAALFSQNVFYWMLLILAAVIAWAFARGGAGLALTAAGHAPGVVEAKGGRPVRLRSAAVLACGALGGLGGAALSMGAIGSFTPGQVNGRGFVAIAVVILGRWRPGGVVAAALLFGFSEALQLRLSDATDVPVQLLGMLPWLVLILMLVAGARRASEPGALGETFSPLEPDALERRLRALLRPGARPTPGGDPQ